MRRWAGLTASRRSVAVRRTLMNSPIWQLGHVAADQHAGLLKLGPGGLARPTQDPQSGWKSVWEPVWRVDDLLNDVDHWSEPG
jgi:hypothetical protein